jgi:hypothetical protein
MVRLFEGAGGIKDSCDFSGTQDHRPFFLVPRVGNMFNHHVAVEHVMVEETQCAHRLIQHCPCDLFALHQNSWYSRMCSGPSRSDESLKYSANFATQRM